MIIFHGTGKRLSTEKQQYHPGIVVEFHKTAYMNDVFVLQYIEKYLIPALNGQHSLFVTDLFAAHKTAPVLEKLSTHDIIPTMIPAGCTSLVQPLDVSINKPLKEYIRSLTSVGIWDFEDIESFERWTVGERQIHTTWCVGDVWYQFCVEKQDIVKKVFRKVGLSLPIDGSADHELDIKGLQEIEVGDWTWIVEKDTENNRLLSDVDAENDDLVEFVM
jgi:hypothetical protein